MDQTVSPKAARESHVDEELVSQTFVLELSGAGIMDVPMDQRRLGPVRLSLQPGNKQMIVGRRHQKEFLQRCVKEDLLDFISRDHFVIDCGPESLMLHAMSQNRIWIIRDGSAIELKKDMTQGLQMGDWIVLGTGILSAEDSFSRLRFLLKSAECV